MDYYKVLEIQRDASQIDIAKQFRRLALIYHPQLSNLNMNQAYKNFCSVSEAYEVLSDSQYIIFQEERKNVYDKFGYEQLKNGQIIDGKLIGYSFQGNPELIFENFFGSSNPYTQIYDKESQQEFGSLLNYAFQVGDEYKLQKPNDLQINVECSLEELYNGCTKDIKYKKIILDTDNTTIKEIEESKKIEILPGYSDNQKIIFKEQGHQASGQKNSDLIFIVKETKHPNFKREKNHLIYTLKITLLQALLSEPTSITCLDGREILFGIDEIVNPKTEKHIKGEGMPLLDQKRIDLSFHRAPYQKGDMIIKFDIIFPQSLDEETKIGLNHILS